MGGAKKGRDYQNNFTKNTQERTTQQSETSPERAHGGKPPLFNNKFVRNDDNGPYVSPLAGGNNLRERTMRKAGAYAIGSPQTELKSYGPY